MRFLTHGPTRNSFTSGARSPTRESVFGPFARRLTKVSPFTPAATFRDRVAGHLVARLA